MPKDLASRALSYQEVGATRGQLPPGYHYVRRTTVLGEGRQAFEAATDRLMTWQAQTGAGLRVVPSAPRAAQDVDVLLGFGLGPLRFPIPCRVVYVVDEENRRGFAYGTLAGHPESGEEAFLITLAPDGRVELEIIAFSRQAAWWAKLSGPIARTVQRWVTGRYMKALGG